MKVRALHPKLPQVAHQFVNAVAKPHQVKTVSVFHYWLAKNQLELRDLTREHVDAFLQRPTGRPISALCRNDYRCSLRPYLNWLHGFGHIRFDAGWLGIRRARLPADAEQFLLSLQPTLRPSTVNHYRNSLRDFYRFLGGRGNDARQLTRADTQAWLQQIYERGLHPHTRLNFAIAIRTFLRTMNASGLLQEDADELIQSSDFPKLPQYLPRPLSTQEDQALREHLAASSDPLTRGLLLMRLTGLRAGELAALEHGCVWIDDRGEAFLKVPLGKLHNERLVPLNPESLALARWLQDGGRQPRERLLETPRGLKVRYMQVKVALDEATRSLGLKGVTSHRLRHTYASTLLNAGVSLLSLMKLLGHTDLRMTMRYAGVSLETVGREYHAALGKLEHRYAMDLNTAPAPELEPAQALSDLIRWMEKQGDRGHADKLRAKSTIRALRALRNRLK